MPVCELKNGIRLQYEEYGTGDRYLLSTQQNHSKIREYTIELADRGFHVFNITYRGCGESTPITEDYGDKWYDIWADETVDFADAMGIDRFFYTGVSHGAGIGWTICIRHPERLAAFLGVVAGPHSKDGQDTGEARMRTIRAAQSEETWRVHVEERVAMARAGLEARGLTGAEYEAEKALTEEWITTLQTMDRAYAAIDPKKPFPHQKTEEELVAVLSTIQVPTLLLGGMHDDISLPKNLVRSCGAVKNCKLIIYEAATHGLDREHQSEICDDIICFCKQRGLL